MSSVKQVTQASEVDERLAALLSNVNAVRALASAVEGTIGPKGLDTMLVDRFGGVVVTNDGITILSEMNVNHPAARMVINTAKAQEEEVGDGTTTATIVAASLLLEAVGQIVKGVPVTRVIEGIRLGIGCAVAYIQAAARPVTGVDDPVLRRVALVAGREHADIADLVVRAAVLVGAPKLRDPGFKLADTVMAKEGADSEVFRGVIVEKERLSKEMPRDLRKPRILIVDDALEPEELKDEAMSTDAGFGRFLQYQQEFKENLQKLVGLGVKVVMVDRGVDEWAEDFLNDAGIMVLSRVATRDLRRAAEHTGARMVKRTTLKKAPEELARYVGRAARVYEDEKLEHVRVLGGGGRPMATILVGAATEEVVNERERIAKDAASAVQAALIGGVVPGGGAIELAAGRAVEKARAEVRGMAAYGVDCVGEALRRPLAQIVANAGYNPLEKVGDVVTAQRESGRDSLGVNCDTGDVADMWELGVIDPTSVKTYALRAAGEITEAILRIDKMIIIRRDEAPDHHAGGAGR
jgi:chaperonin GroEL (HSP60 family)